MKTINTIVGCVVVAITFSGCVTESLIQSKCEGLREEIRANLKSGDSRKRGSAFAELNYAIINGEIDVLVFLERTKVSLSLEERLKFVDCANLEYLLKSQQCPLPLDKYPGDSSGAIRAKILERSASLLPIATKEQKERIMNKMRSSSRYTHVDSEFFAKFLSGLDEKKLSEEWRSLWKCNEEVFVDVFVKKIQSADKLCELIGERNWQPASRAKVEGALMPKVQQLTDMQACWYALSSCEEDRVLNVNNHKLIVKMISVLTDKTRSDLADRYLGRWSHAYKAYYWWNDTPSYNLLNYGVACALTARDIGVARSISNLVLLNLEECRNYVPKNGAKWDENQEKRAANVMKLLISVAGDDWLESVLSRNKDCPSFVIACATPKMADKLLMASKVRNTNTQAALAKIATVDIKKFDEERVAKILSESKRKESSAFVLKGFYLGMPVDDAHVLLRHYFPESKISLVSDRKTGGTSIEIDPVKSDMAKEGEATDMYFCQADKNGKVFRLNFNKKILKKWFKYDVQTYREWAIMFGQQYKCDFRAYTPEKEYSSGSVFIKVSQEAYRYKNNMKEYVVTYFGKFDVYDPNEKDGWNAVGSGNAQVAREFGVAEGIRHYIYGGGWYNYIGAKEGSLRIEVVKD